jgi:hypothetical protein
MIKFRDCLLFAVLMSLISTGALAQANTQVSAQSLKIFWSKASLGLRRGVVVGKIDMATSHLAVER